MEGGIEHGGGGMGEGGERRGPTNEEHVELPPPGERPIKRRGPVVSRRAALGMMVGGAAVGVVGARVGFGSSSGGDLSGIANDRGLDGAQAEAALKTYVPGGDFDEYFIMSSGGHSGNVYVIGVPSMRMLKEIPSSRRTPGRATGTALIKATRS